MRKRSVNFTIAFNKQGKAFGTLVLEDGLSLHTLQENKYSVYQIAANCTEQRCVISIWQVNFGYQSDYRGRLELYGLKNVREVRLKSLAFDWEVEVLRVSIALPLHSNHRAASHIHPQPRSYSKAAFPSTNYLRKPSPPPTPVRMSSGLQTSAVEAHTQSATSENCVAVTRTQRALH